MDPNMFDGVWRTIAIVFALAVVAALAVGVAVGRSW